MAQHFRCTLEEGYVESNKRVKGGAKYADSKKYLHFLFDVPANLTSQRVMVLSQRKLICSWRELERQ